MKGKEKNAEKRCGPTGERKKEEEEGGTPIPFKSMIWKLYLLTSTYILLARM